MNVNGFSRMAKATARFAGRPLCFFIAVAMVLGWALSGPLFDYNNTWQLTINTGTTIVVFLMVFLIQNTQNRDTEALHIKLDELIRVTKSAQNALMDLEDLDEEQLDQARARYEELAKRARNARATAGTEQKWPTCAQAAE